MQSWCFPCCFAWFTKKHWRVNDLRQRPEKPKACVLQIAKQVNYSPKDAANFSWHEQQDPGNGIINFFGKSDSSTSG
jgi:hypothetical protein